MWSSTPREQERLRDGGRILATILREVAALAVPGATTADLNNRAEKLMKDYHVTPAFLGYRGYPAVLCTSVNDQVVHGIPSQHVVLKDGDILGLDIGIQYQRLYTDMAVSVPIGKVSPAAASLLKTTREALQHAIRFLKAGRTTGDLGAEIQEFLEKKKFSVVRDLVGHGVGASLHEDPMIPNFGIRGRGETFTDGMVVALEPMVAAGDWHVRTEKDGWTVSTLDGSLAAHFEHTVLITKSGSEILTHTDGNTPWP